MRCRHRRLGFSLRADALPLGSCCVGGCFATTVGQMLGHRVLGRMLCRLGRLLRWMLCHRRFALADALPPWSFA
jgi:hypothetical protein